ncbi:MAG: peptidoglycan DD-metalloendopeptidase family protein [Betaproteobacteria bacterium]
MNGRDILTANVVAVGLAVHASLLVFALVVGGCASTQAPIGERTVDDYRRSRTEVALQAPPGRDSTRDPRTPGGAPPADAKPPPAPSAKSAPVSPPRPLPSADTGTAQSDAADGDWRPEFYKVKRGDTLYSIALDHGLDYKDLAMWNQLSDPNVIRIDQQLRVRTPPGWKPDVADTDAPITRAAPSPAIEAQPLAPAPAVKAEPKGIKARYSDEAYLQLMQDPATPPWTDNKPAPLEPVNEPRSSTSVASPPKSGALAPGPVAAIPAATLPPIAKPEVPATMAKRDSAAQIDDVQWVWPSNGKVLHLFNQGVNPKGLAISGAVGQPVLASAAGKVVYSGSGLRGYGKLVIIKHNNTYLSVYAHNRTLLVKEGERVSKGQKIAEMGNSDADRVALHFEIRRLGKPVDPLHYLPAQGV